MLKTFCDRKMLYGVGNFMQGLEMPSCMNTSLNIDFITVGVLTGQKLSRDCL